MPESVAKSQGLSIKALANKRSLDDFNGALTGSRVLIRLDLDVPLDSQGNILDDRLLHLALPSLEYILDRRATAIIMSHLGKPRGRFLDKLSLAKVCQRLKQLLDLNHKALAHHQVELAPDITGQAVCKALNSIGSFGILMLENLCFDPREAVNDALFAQDLAAIAGFYINDSLSASNKACASVDKVARYFPPERRAIGFLLQKELAALNLLKNNPARPFIAVVGGYDLREKLPLLEKLCPRVDLVLTGGLLALALQTALQTQFQPQALPQLSQASSDQINHYLSKISAREWQNTRSWYDKCQEKIIFPSDWLANVGDIGPQTCTRYSQILSEAKTIFWNGPLGQIEKSELAEGTLALAKAMAASPAKTIAAGGNTNSFILKHGLVDNFFHASAYNKAFFTHLFKSLPKVLDNISDLSQNAPQDTSWHSDKSKASHR